MSPRVAVYPADLGGCGHYRLIWPGQALAAHGADVLVVEPGPGAGFGQGVWREQQVIATKVVGRALRRQIHTVRTLTDIALPEADVIVLQRPMTDHFAAAIGYFQDHGIAVVVEIDDHFHALSPDNLGARGTHPKLNPSHNIHWLAECARRADMVVVSTPELAKVYGAHGRVRVVRNRIPAHYLELAAHRDDDHVLIGWSGSVDTHPGDLEVTRGAVGQVVRATGAVPFVIGTGRGVRDGLHLDDEPKATGWLPIDDYPKALAALDVGLVPLRPCAFNEAKSALKGLEMAAVGVPFVASGTSEYRRLFREGAGQIADRPREWAGAVRRLIADPAWRAEQRAVGRAVAARNRIEDHAGEWWDAWTAPLRAEAVA